MLKLHWGGARGVCIPKEMKMKEKESWEEEANLRECITDLAQSLQEI